MDKRLIDGLALALLDHAPDAVYWVRKDGSFAYVNQAAADMLGYSREQLQSMNLFEVDAQMNDEFWAVHWQEATASGRMVLQREHRHREGELIPVEVRIRNLRVDNEHYHFSFVRDLRLQQQAEDLAERHELFFQAVFMDAPLPQLVIDTDDMRIVDANRAAREFYGYGDALVGMTIPDINPLPPEQIRALIERANSEGRKFYRVAHRLASGELRDMHVHTGRIRYEGKWFIHATCRDVTELNQARRHLEGFRDLVKRLPVGIFCSEPGPDGRILEANPMLAEILEAESADDLIGRSAAEFYPDPALRLDFSGRVERDGEVRGFEHELLTCKGRRIWVSLAAHRVESEDGKVVIEGAMENISERKRAEQERAVVTEMFRSAIRLAPMPVMLHRADGRIEQVSDVWCELSGYAREQLNSVDQWVQLAYGDKNIEVADEIRSLAELRGRKAEGDFEIRCADESKRIWSFHSVPLEPIGTPGRLIMSAAVDATEERRRQHQAMLANAIIQTASEGVTITDAERNIVNVNPAFSRITGYAREEVIGENPRILSSGRQGKSFYAEMWASIDRDGHWQGEIWNRRKSGEIYPEWLSISAIRDTEGRVTNYAAIFTDLTELKHTQSSLSRLRKFDPLTGLFNQQSFLEHLRQWLEIADDSEHVAVLLLGLDRFRRINESYSNEFGDRILREVAQRLDTMRPRRMLIGRAGSDRFLIALSSSDSDRAVRQLLRSISRSVARPVELDDHEPVQISFSIGIARFPEDGDNAQALLRNAESAMFEAKRTSRGTHRYFDAERAESARRQLWLENELRAAIDSGDVAAWLQPILSVSDDRVVGAEALARWHHPDQGPVSPAEFIPIAEECGLISRLSLMLLASVAPWAARMRSSGRSSGHPDFLLAFNISAVQFRRSDFLERLLDTLDASGLERSGFELELTESTMMEQASNPVEMLARIRAAGLRLSIDDFGTGFSSLAYLQEIRAHTLKIDRRFVSGLGQDSASDQIVQSIIAMAHALDMRVIAEGVEEMVQLDRLRTLGCDFYQGYLVSPAVPAEEFFERYSDSRQRKQA